MDKSAGLDGLAAIMPARMNLADGRIRAHFYIAMSGEIPTD